MLKTNTSYFTGSSQLNNRFFFFVFVSPSEIYIHMAAYRQFLSFDFLLITLHRQTVCITPNSEATTGILKKCTRGAFLGGTLEISYASTSSIHHRVSMFVVKIGIFYMTGSLHGCPEINPNYNLNLMYIIYSGMLKHTETYKKKRD